MLVLSVLDLVLCALAHCPFEAFLYSCNLKIPAAGCRDDGVCPQAAEEQSKLSRMGTQHICPYCWRCYTPLPLAQGISHLGELAYAAVIL